MTSTRRERPLARPELLAAALGIVDAEGLPALTMRRLGDEVGVEAMSLYHHVPSKNVLLDWTLELMRSEMRLSDPLPDDWVDRLAAIFGEYRRVLAAHPNMLPLAGRMTTGSAPAGLEYLIAQGFGADDAVELCQSLLAFTVGFSILSSPFAQLDPPSLPPEMAERSRVWRDGTCERTLRLIMDGYASRREAAHSSVRRAKKAT